MDLDEKQISELWHRSYTAVDGLWFMKVEERYGFEAALDIDDEVWKVLPKIQARMLESCGEIPPGIDGLLDCLTNKLALEGFAFESERAADGRGFKIRISRCPWHDVMVSSGRADLSEKVGTRICPTEYSAWAAEFGDNIRFELGERICGGSVSCILNFSSAQ
jgi:hypothetical protein